MPPRAAQSGTWLCAASGSGTVHVWRLDAQQQQRRASSVAQQLGSSLGAMVGMPLPLVSGERDFASVKIKSGGRCQAAIRDSVARPTEGQQPEGQQQPAGVVSHSLYVWTDRGAWYAYRLDGLRGGGGGCVLQDEQRLLPAAC